MLVTIEPVEILLRVVHKSGKTICGEIQTLTCVGQTREVALRIV